MILISSNVTSRVINHMTYKKIAKLVSKCNQSNKDNSTTTTLQSFTSMKLQT